MMAAVVDVISLKYDLFCLIKKKSFSLTTTVLRIRKYFQAM